MSWFAVHVGVADSVTIMKNTIPVWTKDKAILVSKHIEKSTPSAYQEMLVVFTPAFGSELSADLIQIYP